MYLLPPIKSLAGIYFHKQAIKILLNFAKSLIFTKISSCKIN